MQEARPEAHTCRHLLPVTNRMANALQLGLMLLIHLDEGQQSKIVSRAQLAQMGAEQAGQREIGPGNPFEVRRVAIIGEKLDATVLKNRSFGRKLSGLFVIGRQLSCYNLGGFNVRLVERVDRDNRSRDGRCDLPAEEFLADIVDVRHIDSDYRLSSFAQGIDLGVLLLIDSASQAQIDKDTIVAIDLRRPKLLAVYRDQALPCLPVLSARSCSSQAPRSRIPGD